MVKTPVWQSRMKERALGRGFLAGIFWGGLVGLGLFLVSSQVVERQQLSLPKPEASPVEVPAGTEFDQARPETEPVVPNVETRPSSEAVSGVTPPADLVEAPPAFDTSSLEVPTPTVDAPGALGEVPEVVDGVEVEVTGPGQSASADPVQGELAVPETPVDAPETETQAPEAAPLSEAEEEAPEVAAVAPDAGQTGAAPVQPSFEAPSETPMPETTSEAPQSGEAPAAMEAPVIEGAIEAEGESDPAPSAPMVADGESPSFFQPVDEMEDQAPEVETDRLPRIGDATESEGEDSGGSLPVVRRLGDSSEEDAPASEGEETVETAPAAPAEGPALAVNRVPFDNAEGAPLISVVLRHEGTALPDTATLEALPETIAFAVDAAGAGAADIAAAYRAAGREVVMIPALPAGATPQDVEVAMRVNLETVSQAVAIMDPEGGNFGTDRSGVRQMMDVIAASGHGVITFPRGLNAAHQLAEQADLPRGLIFRDIDGKGENAGAIARSLDRAAFRARQSDAVILVGSTDDLTVRTVVEWAAANRGESVRLAPVSAALQGG